MAPLDLEALKNASPAERAAFCADLYKPYVMPLDTLCVPKLCSIIPHLADELFLAYRSRTIFSVSVWVNYDATENKFFTDRRARDCGKLILRPRAVARLQDLDAQGVQMYNVRINIATPFQRLSWLELHAYNSSGGPKLRITLSKTFGHGYLRDFAADCADAMQAAHKRVGATGITLQALVFYASLFLRKRSTTERWNPYAREQWSQPISGFGEDVGASEDALREDDVQGGSFAGRRLQPARYTL